MNDLIYRASGAEEHFLSLDLEGSGALVGYLRLRLGGEVAQVRELKVFGQMARLGAEGKEGQHRGFGRQLLERAEELANETGHTRIKITSGVGVRRYYAHVGYRLQGRYMVKDL
jgi:elongator complex protein 3